MKSDQAFEVIEIVNKLGLVEVIKGLQVKTSKFEREKRKIFTKIRLENADVLKVNPDAFSEIVEDHELSDRLYELNDEIESLNFDLIGCVLARIPHAKQEVYQFISTFKGITVEEVQNDLNIVVETVKEVMSDPNLQNLFKSLKM